MVVKEITRKECVSDCGFLFLSPGMIIALT